MSEISVLEPLQPGVALDGNFSERTATQVPSPAQSTEHSTAAGMTTSSLEAPKVQLDTAVVAGCSAEHALLRWRPAWVSPAPAVGTSVAYFVELKQVGIFCIRLRMPANSALLNALNTAHSTRGAGERVHV